MTQKHPGGRPSKYTPELIKACEKYVYGGWEECGDIIPSIAGLACEVGVSRDTLHAWANDESKQEFSDIYKDLLSFQERRLLSGGLSGSFSGPITKLVLSKHGYSDKVEQDLSSSDGTMTPNIIVKMEPIKNDPTD